MYKKAIEKFADQQYWYNDIHDYIFATYDNPYLFCGLLAASSPRMSVKKSWNISVELYNRIMAGQKDYDWGYFGLMASQHMNIQRVIDGEKLSGPKVNAFYANLIGDYNAVTIDSWILVFFNCEKRAVGKRYEKFADRIRNYAKKVNMTPAGLQAVLWSYIRDKHGKSHSSYIVSAEIVMDNE